LSISFFFSKKGVGFFPPCLPLYSGTPHSGRDLPPFQSSLPPPHAMAPVFAPSSLGLKPRNFILLRLPPFRGGRCYLSELKCSPPSLLRIVRRQYILLQGPVGNQTLFRFLRLSSFRVIVPLALGSFGRFPRESPGFATSFYDPRDHSRFL